MKKISILTLAFAMVFAFGSCSKDKPTGTSNTNGNNNNNNNPVVEEFLAPTAPQNASVLLENYTGVRCDSCYDGHVKAKAIADANPGKVFIMAVHAGSFANPTAGWANFTTDFGTDLAGQASVMTYPAGTINRMKAADLGATPQKAEGMAMGKDYWTAAATEAMKEATPVNIGAKATLDPATRILTVKVDLYYTAEETVDNNINVALLQDFLYSKQQGGKPEPNNYEQNHVLRDMITGLDGVTVTESKAAGSKVTKKFAYKVPADYHGTGITGGGAVVDSDLKVIVFVSRGKAEILHAVQVDVQ